VDVLISRLRELPGYVPGLGDLIENLPFLILFLWIIFLFSILVYFRGGIKDLEEKMGKGSITHLQIFLWAASAISFVSMITLAFYMILRSH
jgi:hypothetical protein